MKFLKKAGALTLAVIMAAGMLTAGAAYEDLTDKDDIVNKESVQTLVELGVLGGRDDGSFDPTAFMTRQEAAKVMAVMLCGGDFNAVATDAVYFTDTADAWGLTYINYVAEKKIKGGEAA